MIRAQALHGLLLIRIRETYAVPPPLRRAPRPALHELFLEYLQAQALLALEARLAQLRGTFSAIVELPGSQIPDKKYLWM